jgi:glycosyltransferase involved in cell wall biosynthesis
MTPMIDASICIATYNHAQLLNRTLLSIVTQRRHHNIEVIVVDDGNPTAETQSVCYSFPHVRYIRRDRKPGFSNPAIARNIAYRAATGRVIIAQSDDVMHSLGAIDRLIDELQDGQFLLASVYNVDQYFNPDYTRQYNMCSPETPRPYFFLGSVLRRQLYSVGGNEEQLPAPGYDDDLFAACLINGCGLQPVWSNIMGYHQHHPVPKNRELVYAPSEQYYRKFVAEAKAGLRPWCCSGGPWQYED